PVDDELTIDADFEPAPAFTEFPGIESAIRWQTQVDAIVGGEVLRLLGKRSLREVRPRANDRHPEVRSNTDCDHVLCDLSARSHASIKALGHDVGESVVDGDLYID